MDDRRVSIMMIQLGAVRELHRKHPMPFDVSSPVTYNVDAHTDICRHCSVMKGVPVVWPCETAAVANAEPEAEDKWTY